LKQSLLHTSQRYFNDEMRCFWWVFRKKTYRWKFWKWWYLPDL